MANPLQSTAPLRHSSAETIAPVPLPSIEWMVSGTPVPYDAACAAMAERVAGIVAGSVPELVWLLEHPALYSAGTSAKPEDLLRPMQLPVHRAGRGGQYTYHGPGQRVAYVMLDVKRRFGDVRAYVAALEHWIIDTLAAFDVRGERWPGRVGVWVAQDGVSPPAAASGQNTTGGGDGSDPGHDIALEPRAKIAAIGVRLSRWISSHGIALNVAPDLAHYAGIVPCGIRDAGITSLAALGRNVGLNEVDSALRASFEGRFGATAAGPVLFGSAQALPDR